MAFVQRLANTMREWNAEAYHRVSDPMLRLGLNVLERLPLRGDELVLDVGCGTGRITEHLLERLPRGRVLAVDLSANMVRVARDYLGSRFAGRVFFAQADASRLPAIGKADAIFSTATFHWVPDHPALFRSLYAALRPGGRLVVQCGGGPNIRRVHDRCDVLMRQPEFAPHFAGWREPWNFAAADETAARLHDAGFTDVVTGLESTPVIHADAAHYREFVTNIVCRHHLAPLPHDLRERFMDSITDQAAADTPPFELDYWRLNIDARRPAEGSMPNA
jgi:trans-aconitate methyltransferase